MPRDRSSAGRAALLLAAVCALLAACGPAASPPTPQPTAELLPLGTPTPRPAGPAPTVVSQAGELPGRILFVSAGDLWLWQGATGSQLTASGDAWQPAWSPDGARIAFVRRGESYSDLVLLTAPEGAQEQLTNNGSDLPSRSFERIQDVVWAFYPVFSPDGSQLAFASQYGPPYGSPASDYRLALFVAPPAPGGERTLLYADDAGHVGRPTYAPDGGAIVFAFGPAGTAEPRLYRFDLESQSGGPIADAPGQSYDPAFSPDGRWLAFARRHEGGTDVYTMPAEGGAAVRLTASGAARAPAFSPDGTQLAYLAVAPGESGFDLWVVDLRRAADGSLAAGEPRRITSGQKIDADSGVAWGR